MTINHVYMIDIMIYAMCWDIPYKEIATSKKTQFCVTTILAKIYKTNFGVSVK